MAQNFWTICLLHRFRKSRIKLALKFFKTNIIDTSSYFADKSFLNLKLKVLNLISENLMESIRFLMQISCFSYRFLKSFANLKHIFRMLKIYVENIYNHLITFRKHLSWSSKRFLLMLLVHRLNHLTEVINSLSDVYL